MPTYAPTTELETHEVANQPGDWAPRNLFDTDPGCRDAALREGGDWLRAPLTALGEVVGSEAVLALGEAANRHAPELRSFDRRGRRIDEVEFHPAYHALMSLAMEHRIHDIAWTAGRPGGHVAHTALLAVFTQAEAGVMCPMTMSYASVPALRHGGAATAPWVGKLLGGRYDAPLRPLDHKAGITVGMAMTEKQGGSDVRANTTRAFPLGGALYRLVGHKWFCSAPMSDGFLTLAYAEEGLSCFLAPRIAGEGRRNGIQLMRLKDKLGNRSNASAEIEYHDAEALLIGEPGQGLRVILEMVHHTRLGTMAGTVGLMRRALLEAAHHVENRRAFGKRLIDQPLMRSVIADLQLEYEAATALTMRVARSFDGEGEAERALARLGVALGKYLLTKRTPEFVYECLECLGGAGYVEESPLPRLFRESPLNAIWEGSGNVIALDVVRTLRREPAALEAYWAEVDGARSGDPALDRSADALRDALPSLSDDERHARLVAERMARLLQAALLVRHVPDHIAGAFCRTRLAGEWGRAYGTLPDAADAEAIARRVLA